MFTRERKSEICIYKLRYTLGRLCINWMVRVCDPVETTCLNIGKKLPIFFCI